MRLAGLTIAMLLTLSACDVVAQPTAEPKPLAPGIVEIAVEDLHCKTCAKKVARKLYAVKGVKKVTTSLQRDLVTIQIPKNTQVPVAKLWGAVAAADTPPVTIRFAGTRLDAEQVKPLLAAAKTDGSLQ